MKATRFFINDEGVSPIIATLVLIVVAIIGAAAVGLIMSNFSSSVSNQANAGNTASQSSTTLTVAGSGGMQPTIYQIAQWYNTNTTGVKADVIGGNTGVSDTGVGFMSVEKEIADIGMVNEGPDAVNYVAQLSTYPNLKSYQVGASGVVFVAGAPFGSTPYTMITKADLTYLYANGIPSGNTWTDSLGNVWAGVVGRSDIAAPMDIGMSYLGLNSNTVKANPNVIGEPGAGPVAQMVGTNIEYIGVMNVEDISSYNNIVILAIDDQANSKIYTPTTTSNRLAVDNVISETKNNGNTWPTGLIRPLNLVTNGPASSLDRSFIQYCQSPTAANQDIFNQRNEVHVSQVNPVFLE